MLLKMIKKNVQGYFFYFYFFKGHQIQQEIKLKCILVLNKETLVFVSKKFRRYLKSIAFRSLAIFLATEFLTLQIINLLNISKFI